MKTDMFLCVLFFSLVSSAQSPGSQKYTREGNDLYRQQQFEKAGMAYASALKADPGDGPARFNLGNALYKQNKPGEAVKVFTELADNKGKNEIRAKAYYNKGAVLSRQKKLEESIEAYKETLRLDPEDREARENLQKALIELKKKNPPKKKEDPGKKEKQPKQDPIQSQSKMNPKEARQRLQLLAQKEKQVQQRIQKEKLKPGGNQTKDW